MDTEPAGNDDVHPHTSEKQIDVLGLGSVTVDFVGAIDRWPTEGSKQSLRNLDVCDGGLVGTALVAVARLGGKARFAAKLGHSENARRAIRQLQIEGIDTSFVIPTPNAEPITSFIFTNPASGQRNIFWSIQNVQYPGPAEFPDDKWHEKIKVLLVDHEAGRPGVEAARIATENNIPVVVDVEQPLPHVPELLEFSSHIIVSQDFAVEYTGQAEPEKIFPALTVRDGQVIVLTRGEKGCLGLWPRGVFELPAFRVDTVDTTGCGDVFHGGFALEVARGTSPPQAARTASAAAAMCSCHYGGRAGIPTEKELREFLVEHQD